MPWNSKYFVNRSVPDISQRSLQVVRNATTKTLLSHCPQASLICTSGESEYLGSVCAVGVGSIPFEKFCTMHGLAIQMHSRKERWTITNNLMQLKSSESHTIEL
mmetsp:Transcript_54217/g.86185  ORF Transcript_54217/g.86185 Transcript_54217/m.86185 type:complete len:104 (-) Transcript_54217:47-358(-)